MVSITLIIDEDVLKEYDKYYFGLHPKATKRQIAQPYHESINTWMILRRPAMNGLKGKWKKFIKWFVEYSGYHNLSIKKCEIEQTIYYANNRRHDPDNSVPKFILDGLVEGGMLEDDDSKHIRKLSLICDIDSDHPRTEIVFSIFD